MPRPLVSVKSVSTVLILVMVLAGCSEPRRESGPSPASHLLSGERPEVDAGDQARSGLEILYPLDEALFPPDVVAPTFRWIGPDWSDINNPDTTAIGFLKGDGLTEENAELLDTFIAGLADGSISLWQGPLNFQDGSPLLAAGETATPLQIWYMPALLQGIEGAAAAN